MAITEKNILNNWFRTGAKPTQEQFWNWQDSYWHKNEAIPQSQIQDLDTTLANKVDSSALNAKANADSSGMTSDNIISWKKALGVGEVPDNMATIDKDGKLGNVYDKTQVDDLLESSGKNIGNSDLKVPEGEDRELDLTRVNFKFKGVQSAQGDASFNKRPKFKGDGTFGMVDENVVVKEDLVKALSLMSDTEKDTLRRLSLKNNEKYSTGQPRVDVLLPPLIDLSSSGEGSILVTGLNLFINNVDKVSSIDVIKVSNNEVVETIQNVMVHQTMPTQLTFDINKSLYTADEYYTIQITHNGIKSILNKNATFRVVSQIVQNEVDMQWKLINHSRTIGDSGSVRFSSDAKSFTVSQPGSGLIESGTVNVVSEKEFDFNKGYMFFISFRAGLPSQHTWTWFGNIWMSFIAKENVNENTNAFFGTDATAIIGQAFNNNMRLAGFSDDRGMGGSGENIDTSVDASYSFVMMVKGGIVKFIYNNRVYIKRLTPTSSNIYTLIGSFFRRYNNTHHSLCFSVDNIVEF